MKVVSRRKKGEKYEHKRLFCASVDDRNSGTLFLHRVITEWPLDGQTFCLIRGNIGVLACLQSCGHFFLRRKWRKFARVTYARKPAPKGTTISKDQGTLTFLLFTKRFVDYYIVIISTQLFDIQLR